MEKSTIWKFLDEDLDDYTLIIPSIAVGNMSQLACGYLIHSLNMVKIGSIYTTAQIPVIGHDPFNLKSETLATSCEIFKSDENKICILQIRSPLIYKYAKQFLNEVIETFQEKKIKDVIILTSSFSVDRRLTLFAGTFKYVISEGNPYTETLESNDYFEKHESDGGLQILGGGFACSLYKICLERSLPCLILFKYCTEGDNLCDVYSMVSKITIVYPLYRDNKDLLDRLIQPQSWKLLMASTLASDEFPV